MAGFKKRVITPEQAQAVAQAAASAPIGGDPRLESAAPAVAQVVRATPIAAVVTSHGALHEAGRRYEVGKVEEVPVGLVNSNPFNPRAVYTSSAVDEMVESMSEKGQLQAATAFVDDTGAIVLIEGETRLRAVRALGLPTLRIEFRKRPESDRALYEQARSANFDRNEQTPLDDALKWKEYLAKKLYPSQSALAKALKLGEDHVSRILSLASMSRRVIDALSEEPDLLTAKMLNAIREFWSIKGDDGTLELILEASRTGMGYRDVLAKRKAVEKGPVKRTRSSRESLSFRGGSGELRSFADAGRIEFKLTGLNPQDAEDATAKIMEIFKKT
jgi:ParB family chromosome partitioning protein